MRWKGDGPLAGPITAEERTVLSMYRDISRWEKNGLYLLLQSLAWGNLNHDKTDSLAWDEMREHLALPAIGAAETGQPEQATNNGSEGREERRVVARDAPVELAHVIERSPKWHNKPTAKTRRSSSHRSYAADS